MTKATRASIILDDPFSWFIQARAENPVCWNERRQLWEVYRYADIEQVLRNYKLYSSLNVYTPFKVTSSSTAHGAQNPLVGTLGDVDPPYHRQLRSFGQPSFTIRQVERYIPRIHQIADEFLDRLQHEHVFDFHTQFAQPLPLMVLAEILGIPVGELSHFVNLAIGFMDGMPASRLALVMYFDKLIRQRRSDLGEDFISDVLRAQTDEHTLSHMEILGYCMSLIFAASHTTTLLFSNILICFSEFPEQHKLLIENPQLIPGAIEEVLRYRSSIWMAVRSATQDTVLGGQSIRAGQRLWLYILSANHDEAVFSEPEQLDITRQPNSHISFGRGIHYCLGAPLARLQTKIVFELLLQKMPNLHIIPGSTLDRVPGTIFFGYVPVPVTQSQL